MMAAERAAAKAPNAELRNAILSEAAALEKAKAAWSAMDVAKKLAADALDESNSDVNEINAQPSALLRKIKTYGMLPEAITAVQIAELESSIIAFMGKMGVFGGTGGGGPAATTFEDRQKTQGTGTVLGDDSAKSESIAKSLEIMEQNFSMELSYQNSMLQALRNIETALGGAAKGIFQTAGLTGGSAFGTTNTSSKSFFGSDKSTTITDTGVRFTGSLGELRAGGGKGIQYEDVTKTSDGGWFHGNKTSTNTNTKALGDAAMKPFTLIFDNMGDLPTEQISFDDIPLAPNAEVTITVASNPGTRVAVGTIKVGDWRQFIGDGTGGGTTYGAESDRKSYTSKIQFRWHVRDHQASQQSKRQLQRSDRRRSGNVRRCNPGGNHGGGRAV